MITKDQIIDKIDLRDPLKLSLVGQSLQNNISQFNQQFLNASLVDIKDESNQITKQINTLFNLINEDSNDSFFNFFKSKKSQSLNQQKELIESCVIALEMQMKSLLLKSTKKNLVFNQFLEKALNFNNECALYLEVLNDYNNNTILVQRYQQLQLSQQLISQMTASIELLINNNSQLIQQCEIIINQLIPQWKQQLAQDNIQSLNMINELKLMQELIN